MTPTRMDQRGQVDIGTILQCIKKAQAHFEEASRINQKTNIILQENNRRLAAYRESIQQKRKAEIPHQGQDSFNSCNILYLTNAKEQEYKFLPETRREWKKSLYNFLNEHLQ